MQRECAGLFIPYCYHPHDVTNIMYLQVTSSITDTETKLITGKVKVTFSMDVLHERNTYVSSNGSIGGYSHTPSVENLVVYWGNHQQKSVVSQDHHSSNFHLPPADSMGRGGGLPPSSIQSLRSDHSSSSDFNHRHFNHSYSAAPSISSYNAPASVRIISNQDHLAITNPQFLSQHQSQSRRTRDSPYSYDSKPQLNTTPQAVYEPPQPYSEVYHKPPIGNSSDSVYSSSTQQSFGSRKPPAVNYQPPTAPSISNRGGGGGGGYSNTPSYSVPQTIPEYDHPLDDDLTKDHEDIANVNDSPLFTVVVMEFSTVELKAAHKFKKNKPAVKVFCDNFYKATEVSSPRCIHLNSKLI